MVFLATGGSAHAGESAGLLTAAETYFLKSSFHDQQGCEIDRTAVARRASREMAGVSKLRPVAEEAVPDIHLTLTVESSAIPGGPDKPEACLYMVNARAIHPMFGQMRYASVPRLIQALTFNKTIYSVITPGKLGEALDIQTAKAIGLFLDEYRAGNSR